MLKGDLNGRPVPNQLYVHPPAESCARCVIARRDLRDALEGMLAAHRRSAAIAGWSGFLVLAAEKAEEALRERRPPTIDEAANLKGAIAFTRKALL